VASLRDAARPGAAIAVLGVALAGLAVADPAPGASDAGGDAAAQDGGGPDAGPDADPDAGPDAGLDAWIEPPPEIYTGAPDAGAASDGVETAPFPAGGVPGLPRLPPGHGAVIVPALTTADTEPGWSLSGEAGFRGSAVAGKAVAAPPGRYEVLAGSGARAQRARVKVDVRAGELARVRPTWGALVVHTIDRDETPFRGPYLLFDLITREPYGFGRGAQEEVGEQVDAWLLRPSIYKIIGPLEDLDTVVNFATVEVRPGEVKHFVVVMDPTSGDFHGSGVVPTADFTVRGSLLGHRQKKETRPDAFKVKARVGGDVAQSSSDNVLGVGGASLGFGLFTDFAASYRWKRHLFNLLLDVKGGVRKNSGESFVRKVQDELSLESIYIHQTWPRVGFYARVMATTQIANTNLRYEEPTEVVILGEEPRSVRKVRVAASLDPLFLLESAGVNLRLIRHVAADVDARLGLSLRQTVTSGFLVSSDDPDTTVVELERADRSFNVGGEVVLAATTRLTQIASLRIDVDLFLAKEIQVLAEATLSIRLFGPMSIGILGALRRDDLTNMRIGLSEAVFIRASKQVF
jgi:hypothetical protein